MTMPAHPTAAPRSRKTPPGRHLRHLVLVLGDQLDVRSAVFDGFDAEQDAVWMAEVRQEATYVWSHKARIALLLAAMRHFRNALRRRGFRVCYRQLDDAENRGSFAAELKATVQKMTPRRLIVVEPGEWRVKQTLDATARELGIELEIRPDRHFLCSREHFAAHVKGRKQLRMEFFYREMRRRHRVLMNSDEPEGGAWNFDAANREHFGKAGPGTISEPVPFRPDEVTREVLALVEERFTQHPGSLRHFDWPVTRAQASTALRDFIEHRFPDFGRYQDAMWTERGDLLGDQVRRCQTFLFHSRLSAALNLKLLDPREVIAAAEAAYRAGHAPLASVEGFIRQVLGWREYVHGIYWHFMPRYARLNALNATEPLPGFYWTARTDMNCLREVIGQTLEYGYAHHIQRLMVTGLFALLLGVKPQAVHEWYLAMYVDAVEWVELPNTLGMSQFADGGLMASKPYVASGRYIQRMSNYCAGCRFDPAKATGENACPFTTFYWDFLMRQEKLLARNPRMTMQLKNLGRFSLEEEMKIRNQAQALRNSLAAAPAKA